MIKEYKVDERIRKEIIKTQYKKHPAWNKTKWIRSLLQILMLIIPFLIIFSYNIAFKKNEVDNLSFIKCIIAAVTSLAIILTVYIGAIRIMQIKYNDIADFKINESLILKDNYFENGYKPGREGISRTYDIIKMNYKDIDRMVLNKYHNRLRIWGTYLDTRYFDYEKGELEYSEKEKGAIAFYLYYDNNEEFINTIVQKSGIKMEIINKSEK